MINSNNFHYYLRYLVKITDKKPIPYDEIPKAFRNFFTVPALSQSLNILIRLPTPINWSEVENYLNSNKFENFDSLINGIKNNFHTDIDKLYACYYYTTHNIQFENFLDKESKPLSIDSVFQTNKGKCGDYSRFLIQLAKKVGIRSKCIQIEYFNNFAKGRKWDPLNPPKEPRRGHGCVYINIEGEEFLSEPTWGAGTVDDEGKFTFSFKKSYFLIPFYSGLLTHFPVNNYFTQLQHFPFSYENFINLNQSNIYRELSLESNPFQFNRVKNGFYEMQFSFIQANKNISCKFLHKQENEWIKKDTKFVSFECLESDLPSHFYSFFPEQKRCRYRMKVFFPEKGSWIVKVYSINKLFTVYFEVENSIEMIQTILGKDKEEAGFIPIKPTEGLTVITKGYARIRFAVKQKRSLLLIKMFKIKKGTFERESNEFIKNCCCVFTLNFPFEQKEVDENEKLVEDWIFIEFPENGRWEVYIYFKNESGKYNHGVTYFFDVFGAGFHVESPIFDLPKNRKFVPFYSNLSEKIRVEPSSSVVLLNDFDFFFHLFSENKVKIYFILHGEMKPNHIKPTLISEKQTSENKIVDREYSITFSKNSHYDLIFKEKNCFCIQQFFVGDFNLPDESDEEKKLMEKIQKQINRKIDYNDDIPFDIQKEVDLMIQNEIKEKERIIKEQNEFKIEYEKMRIEEEKEMEIEEELIKQEIDKINELIESKINEYDDDDYNESNEILKSQIKNENQIEQTNFIKINQDSNKTNIKDAKIIEKEKSPIKKEKNYKKIINQLKEKNSELEKKNENMQLQLNEINMKENQMKIDLEKQIIHIKDELEKKSFQTNQIQNEKLEKIEKGIAEIRKVLFIIFVLMIFVLFLIIYK
ncbi:hypothetical protein M9Y10_010647 [Tritrichomonas musculus]|uniref:Transglutaminase-like domain-containing protein n=1 Tax=Tritrichomonas musculus TaxID=1915356 RepID=A0ABR2INU5_9EUKA